MNLISLTISNDRGNFLVISSTVAYTIAFTWGGLIAPWGSAKVLVPLVLGLVGLVVFIAYEATIATHPLVRASLCNCIRAPSHLVASGAILPNDKFDQHQRVRNIVVNHPLSQQLTHIRYIQTFCNTVVTLAIICKFS